MCPNCHRPVIARRKPHCLYCGAALPEELLFTPEECAAIEAEMQALEAQRQMRKAKEEEDRTQAQGGDGGVMFIPPGE
jgi:hypothetical protein